MTVSIKSLTTINNSFVGPLLEYADIYDKSFNKSLKRELEAAKYNTRLVITSTIRGIFLEWLYHKL